jgi:subtilisin-like proprotein convertase family protein
MKITSKTNKTFCSHGIVLGTMIAVALMTKTAHAQTDFFTTPGPLTDGGNAAFTFDVSGLSAISDVSLTLNLTHSWIGDLNIYLISPTGNTLMLYNGNGNFGIDFVDTYLNDAGVNLTTGGAPFTGSFLADGSTGTFSDNGIDFTPDISTFSGFIGSDPNGTWTLQVNDTANGDTGDMLATTKLSFLLTPAPEPGTMGLLTAGMSGAGVLLRRRKK